MNEESAKLSEKDVDIPYEEPYTCTHKEKYLSNTNGELTKMTKRLFVPTVYAIVETRNKEYYPNRQYKVSLGFENGSDVLVLKVQMLTDGLLNGRLAPAYPIEDVPYINQAYLELREAYFAIPQSIRGSVTDKEVMLNTTESHKLDVSEYMKSFVEEMED